MLDAKTTDALEITLEEFKNHPSFEEGWETFKANAEAARMLYNMRMETRLTQKAFAELTNVDVDTIVQIEETNYEGDAFSLLEKIASILQKKAECLAGKEEANTTAI